MRAQQVNPESPQGRGGTEAQEVPPAPAGRPAFTSLIDAKAAGLLLGVPYTWLLAQARQGRIPHRLGHYVRFDPDDLKNWLSQTRIDPRAPLRRRR